MEILVSGSMAYDRIMDFPGRFADHIVPEKIDTINLSFTVNGLAEKFGGTAGNIAYALALLGERPRILATMGHDYHSYYEWLEQCRIATGDIRIIPEELTASAYITTDLAGNQITGFNPGAMKYPSEAGFSGIDPAQSIALVGPGNLQDMADYARSYQQMGVFSIFDPGQSLPVWQGEDLASAIRHCRMLVSNDYELSLIMDKTGMSTAQLLESVETIVTTKAENGTEVVTREGVMQVPAIPTRELVDPTGAGDAFRGGLIKGLVLKRSVERAVQMGTVCGHYAIQHSGTQEYSFTMDQFNAKLVEHFGS
ncbi:MAG: carbohydrate kinase family protein [SAR202 cluster bacterium Io17-Chloro-G9]|nr:MAG: carbohydrate kinase family protein [SAR202 cluster bacterium Io17-Chloro-G9]